jgi:hypothetical protein
MIKRALLVLKLGRCTQGPHKLYLNKLKVSKQINFEKNNYFSYTVFGRKDDILGAITFELFHHLYIYIKI